MYLKFLEIAGFKSFPQKTTLTFEPGIIVIVGPNGCGKSNVLDSIRWTLGEQSPKSLRGTKMEDVIFGGTEKLSPFNLAEVTLNFSNTPKMLDVDFEEVSITRKIFRSGESEYYLNKSPVRKKDIQDLLISVGLGEGSYSFVAQGTIENILTSKPEDKRVIFDEASGILQFKEKKREVARKLADTDENLIRLEDVITEVKRQRDSLHRQVQRAKKYKEFQDQLKNVEKDIAIYNLKVMGEKKDEFEKELDNFISEEKNKNGELNSKNSELESKERELESVRTKREETNARATSYESEMANYRHTIQTNQQRITEFQDRLRDLNNNSTAYSQRLNDQKERIKQLKEERESIDGKCAESREKIQDYEKNIESCIEENKNKNKEIKNDKEKILGLENEKTEISNELVDVQSQLNSFSSRKKRLVIEVSKSEEEYSEYEKKFSELKTAIESISSSISNLKEKQAGLNERIKSAESQKDSLQKEKESKEKELLTLVSQLEFLKNLQTRYQNFPNTKEITLSMEGDSVNVPSVIVAKIDSDSQREESGGILRIKTKAKLISQEVGQLEQKKNILEKDIEEINQRINNCEEKNSLLYKEREDSQAELDTKEHDLLRNKEIAKNQEENLNRLKEEKELFEYELTEAEQELNSFNKKHAELKEKLSAKDYEINNVKEEISGAEKLIAENEAKIKQMEIESTRLNTLITSLEEEKKTKDNTIEVFTRDLNTLFSQLEIAEKENVQLKEKISHCAQDNEKLTENIKSKETETVKIKDEINSFKEKENELLTCQKEISTVIKNIQEAAEEIRKKIYDKKLQMQNLSFEKDKVISDLKQMYEIELAPEEVSSRDIKDISLDEMSSNRDALKRKMKYLGNVNLGALDEFEELNQRFEFLEHQREDLVNSKESLRKAINRINRTSRDMFLDSFEKIRTEFKKLFRFLFGGGKADIFLLDKDNVLDSGIDIVVQPPEKKLQNVTLLSGGEKSLTAIALIFSIFKIKPSPLCILDEIDAPLDESNVDRFGHVLSEFSKKSQFIVISHNKKTISRADRMYGVTMQESGVSKVVSVDFKESSSAPSSVSNPA